MSLRKLGSLSLMIGLLSLGFGLLAGCDDDEVKKAFLPPNIGTDPATGGQAPAAASVETAPLAAESPAATVAPPAVAPAQFVGRDGNPIPLDCGTSVNCSVFLCRQQAQAYFLAVGCAKLDGNDNDGQACEGVPAALRAQGVTQAQWDTPCLP